MNKAKIFLTITVLLFSSFIHAKVAPVSDWQCGMMKKTGVLAESAPVGCDRLSKVDFEFVDFEHKVQQGSVIVLDVIAPSVEQIFVGLRERHFPLNSARLMREFKGDDNASMSANNSSAFNARPITGGSGWSKHAYGVAIDINPVQNPYLAFAPDGTITVKPPQSLKQYVNRKEYRARSEVKRVGMAEEVVDLFAHHGFLIWGGDWNTPIDTQHFEVGSRAFVNKLVSLPKNQAMKLFEQYTRSYRDCVIQGSFKDAQQARAQCAHSTINRY
ncbi:M15 family metallopeptidase [Vibrio maerlii]|uniref:M15 family metallopeptidase n=1 Tax=Vibrio maerlii TaxID=2231648 RepID=UPI001F146805|nr:M15 family metallopeptidase [Vibrio maerlii]